MEVKNKIRKNAQEILNLYNYFNGAVILDKDGVVVYYYNNRRDINDLTEEEVIGRSIGEIFPGIGIEESSIMNALKNGIPTANSFQVWKNFKGQTVKAINTTLPIFDEDEIIGVAEVSRYVTGDEELANIYVTSVPQRSVKPLYRLADIKSSWSGMEDIKRIISKVADTDSSVLIYGKTGTGKELVAESIHSEGKRSGKKFLSQNCAAIPPSLLESILFGTVKGSFTGSENRIGLLEAANGGTLFLDEINTMDLNLQAKILKAIEEKTITRVGGLDPISVDVRVIAASNENPWEMVQKGIIREDLYYRLKVVQIDLPLLSERSGDVEYLADYFIRKYNKLLGKNVLGLNDEVSLFFKEYPWPGNIRELENTIEGCLNFTDGPLIKMEDISWYKPKSKNAQEAPRLCGTLKETVKAYEKQLIGEAMAAHGDIQKIADELQITRQNLNNKIKEYGLNFQIKN